MTEGLPEKLYLVNEIFFSLQGEGVRTGTANVFVRFAGCNLKCNGQETPEGAFQPVCDTEFVAGVKLTVSDLVSAVEALWPMNRGGQSIIFTGGEPGLQLDLELTSAFKRLGWYLAVETNGTRPLPDNLDWITVSPKTAEHTLVVKRASEVKYVRQSGLPLPRPSIAADYFLISPHVQPEGNIRPDDLAWCINLVLGNPQWRLSTQQHKGWHLR